uniref:Uncharacterized protein n=1 Tax=Avena sativa TaxID=4498 RepID=A0ACD5ZL59_AVESA
MRTRFLATDYFAPSAAASSSEQALSLASLRFPPLPVPSLPPDPQFPFPLPFPAVTDLPAFSISGDDLDSLPVSSAISEFIAAVIPQVLPVPTIPAADDGWGWDDYLYDRGVYSKGFSSWESLVSRTPDGSDEINREKDGNGEGSRADRSGTSADTERWELLKELQFEVVEVDLPQILEGHVASSGGDESGDGVTVRIRVPDVKIHLDYIDIDTEMTPLKYPTELADSIYQVEKIPVEHNDEVDHFSATNSSLSAIAALDCGIIIPQLEVSRHSWELDDCPAKVEISSIFHNLAQHLGEAQVQHSAFNSTEFSRSIDMDMLAFVSKDAPCADYQVGEPTTVKDAVEMDLVRINDNILVDRNSALYPLKPDGTCSDLPCSIMLEEVQIIDFPSDDVFKTLVQSAAELNTSDEIFKDDFDQAKRFYDSMVSSELVLVDDTFISLPTPILTDDDMTLRSMVPPIGEVLCSLKPHSLSAADGIYLDWHLLLEGPCNRESCSAYASMVEEVKSCHSNSELQVSCQDTSGLSFDFLEYFWKSAKNQDEDKQNSVYIPAPLPHDPPAVVETTQKYRQERGTGGHSHMEKMSSEKAASLFESTSQSNDLNFFLNVRSGTKRGSNEENVSTLDIPTLKEQAVPFSSRPKVDKLIEIHPVSLSDSIRVLIKDIHISCTSALQESANIPTSFPFNEFDIVLEYGGPNKSSTLLSLAPKLDGFPPLHFLYVKVDTEDSLIALVEDDPTEQDLKATMDTVLHALQKDLQEKMNKMRIVDSLNFIPATNQLQGLQGNLCKHLTADSTKKLPVDDQLLKLENLGKKNISDAPNFAPVAEPWHVAEMLSKRTILDSQNFVPAVEKSSSTSFVSANVMKAPQDNLSATDFPSSVKVGSIISGRLSTPEAVIVVNTGSHGKSMLFSRRSSYQQILSLEKGGMQVVERDVDLPVDLILSAAVCIVWCETKMFGCNEFSTSTETSSITNFVETIATNILMSISFCFSGCIMVFEGEPHSLSAVMESSDSLYAAAASLVMNLQLFFSHTPKSTDEIILSCIRNVTRLNKAPPHIPESESLAESFLTKFPSINPLSAYIILSSAGSLVEFLGWSHERRIQAIGNSLLSPLSISLFSALCKFGELGESRSVMTECSSVDSDICSALLQSPRKRKRRAAQAFAVPTSNPLCSNPLNQLPGDYVEHNNVFSPPKLRRFSDMEGATPQLQEAFMFDQSFRRGAEDVSCLPRKNADQITGDELTEDMRTYNGRASGMVDAYDFSWQPELGGKEPIESSFPASGPSFSRTYSHPVFPTALEINDDIGDWDFSAGGHHTSKGHAHGDNSTTSHRYDDVGSRYHEPREEMMRSPGSSLAFLKQNVGSDAASRGSGWEIDYLRQMNEKRRARQERSSVMMSNSRMRDVAAQIPSPPPIESFRYRGDRDTPLRERSPSIGTRYRGGRVTPSRDQIPSIGSHRYGKAREETRTPMHRARKDFKVQPSASHENRIEPSMDPTWTPVDKRARQKLSFATYGKEKQSKLIWRNQNSPGIGCGFRKRYREEGT